MIDRTGTGVTLAWHSTSRKLAYAIIQRMFSALKLNNFIGKSWLILMFAKNIDCGYTLEPPHQGGGSSNEYPQCMF